MRLTIRSRLSTSLGMRTCCWLLVLRCWFLVPDSYSLAFAPTTKNQQQLACLSYRPSLDLAVVVFAFDDALHVNAGRVDRVWRNLADLDQILNFRDRHLRGGRHHGIEVPRGLAINEIAPLVALPGADESKIGFQPSLHDVSAAIELAHFLAFSDDSADARRSEEGGNTGTPGANALRKSSLRDQLQVEPFLEDHLLEKPVFADIAADVALNLACVEEQSHAKAVDSDVVANGVEVLHAFAHQGANQVFGDAAETEAAHHDGGALKDVLNGLVCTGDDFIHR